MIEQIQKISKPIPMKKHTTHRITLLPKKLPLFITLLTPQNSKSESHPQNATNILLWSLWPTLRYLSA